MDQDPINQPAGPSKPDTGPASSVDDAITSRRSIRRYLDTPVSRETIEHLLAVASRAPSGTNMQPWKAYVVAGETKQQLTDAILNAYYEDDYQTDQEYKYYPDQFPEPYKSRRRAVGWGLYGLLGIQKGEAQKMRDQAARNYMFFDAPVAVIFTIDRVLEIGSWLDYGGFLQSISISARGHGLHSCPQAALARYHEISRPLLGIPDTEIVVCGMSIGYADPDAPENSLVTEREPVSSFATFSGFE